MGLKIQITKQSMKIHDLLVTSFMDAFKKDQSGFLEEGI